MDYYDKNIFPIIYSYLSVDDISETIIKSDDIDIILKELIKYSKILDIKKKIYGTYHISDRENLMNMNKNNIIPKELFIHSGLDIKKSDIPEGVQKIYIFNNNVSIIFPESVEFIKFPDGYHVNPNFLPKDIKTIIFPSISEFNNVYRTRINLYHYPESLRHIKIDNPELLNYIPLNIRTVIMYEYDEKRIEYIQKFRHINKIGFTLSFTKYPTDNINIKLEYNIKELDLTLYMLNKFSSIVNIDGYIEKINFNSINLDMKKIKLPETVKTIEFRCYPCSKINMCIPEYINHIVFDVYTEYIKILPKHINCLTIQKLKVKIPKDILPENLIYFIIEDTDIMINDIYISENIKYIEYNNDTVSVKEVLEKINRKNIIIKINGVMNYI